MCKLFDVSEFLGLRFEEQVSCTLADAKGTSQVCVPTGLSGHLVVDGLHPAAILPQLCDALLTSSASDQGGKYLGACDVLGTGVDPRSERSERPASCSNTLLLI